MERCNRMQLLSQSAKMGSQLFSAFSLDGTYVKPVRGNSSEHFIVSSRTLYDFLFIYTTFSSVTVTKIHSSCLFSCFYDRFH